MRRSRGGHWSGRLGREVIGEGSATRNRGGRTLELEKKAAPVHGFDWARVREYQWAMGKVSPKLIRPARIYSEGSTASTEMAAMALIARLSYGLILQSKWRVSIGGWWRSLPG